MRLQVPEPHGAVMLTEQMRPKVCTGTRALAPSRGLLWVAP